MRLFHFVFKFHRAKKYLNEGGVFRSGFDLMKCVI